MKNKIYWIITLLFPLFLLGFIEIALIIGGYNEEAQDLFIEVPSQPDYLITNSSFVPRYFPSFKPQVAVSPFLKKKKANTFRIFVLGGSSTQGYPYNFYYSFAEQLEQKLLLETDGLNIEVVNLGMTAVNSYVIWDISNRLMDYQPDAIIVYAGHNEYYGSFGAGTTQFGLINSIRVKRMVLSLKNLRLYQLLENLFRPKDNEKNKQRTMMASVIRESKIELGGEIYSSGIKQFKRNIGDVAELFKSNGVPILLGTVASNLKDQPPLSDKNEALKAYAEGEKHFETGDKNAAITLFDEAKELDEIRFRAPNEINELINDFAKDPNVHLVDVERMIRSNSTSGIEDESMFVDHLHPNFMGHKLMADLFFEHLLELERIKRAYSPNVFDTPEDISQFEKAYAEITVSRLMSGYPFQKGLSETEELEKFNEVYKDLMRSSYVDSIAAVTKVNQKSVPDALKKIVDQQMKADNAREVMPHYYEMLKWQLNSVDLIERGIEYAINNPQANAYLVNIIEQVLNEGAYDPRYMNVLSSIYTDNKAYDKAKYWLDESLRLGSNEPVLYYNLTRYYLFKEDTAEATRYHQKFLQSRR
ncbi:SGNH/GDSL hydrolase family protein [Gracilimonas sediminicola]|uniref:SGNH/GDSL hydrolase family protein n=1 Tax=Gracilimonas sediminicola TaxID=2952158 RepID=A0A9X2L5Z1_9BACT|nr:SGNH/GDSL hydrolase family protein [Gracilimonas sediminicola]MCP9292986.1 SGNH/GDSL hydrolase family protein [Gracilimonas sediminicola]